ncbi:lysylphosphatidylglycerol synthase transmembrane domain-containing protein [Aquabacterium sp.]|uniref:lysylphosphatidylglycerol synthase transmembrane domain-containing protein n=1 Tax=Aquabacterium sp. TaxID=1872578 RepID=UPI003D6D5DD7
MLSSVPRPPASSSGSLWRNLLTYGLIAGFAIWCVVGFHHDLSKISLAPLVAGWPAIVMAAALSLLNYALRVVRWQLYLSRLGHSLPWRFVSLTFMSGFAFTLSPGKLGEMVRARYYQPLGIPVSGLMAGFFVERLLDLLAMILLAVAVLAELQAYRQALWVAVGLVVGLMATLALVPWPKVAESMAGHPRAGSRLFNVAQSAVAMLGSARLFLKPGILVMGLSLGLVAWGAEAIGLKLVGDVISTAPLSLSSAMGIYAIAIIVGALSFLPGGLGSTEAVMASLLYAHGYQLPEAILLTLVCRLLTLWLAVLIGWCCVWALRGQR